MAATVSGVLSEAADDRTDRADPPPPSASYRWLVLVFVSLAMFGNYYVVRRAESRRAAARVAARASRRRRSGCSTRAYNVAALLVLLAGGVIIDRSGTRSARSCFRRRRASSGAVVIACGADAISAMAAGRFVLGIGAEPLIVAATDVARAVVQGQGAELRVGRQPHHRAARVGGRRQLADLGAPGLFDGWQPPLIWRPRRCRLRRGRRPALLDARDVAARARTAWASAGDTDKLVLRRPRSLQCRAYWYVVGLCVTFYSAIFPFRRFAIIFFIDAHGADAARPRAAQRPAAADGHVRDAALRPAGRPDRPPGAAHGRRLGRCSSRSSC